MKERANGLLRFLDRYVGIPLTVAMGLLHRRRALPTKIQSIALIKSAGIGDTVLLTAIIRDLQEAFPQAQITLFTGTSNYALGQMIPKINVVSLPMTRPFKALRSLRKERFDLWFDCEPWPRITALFSLFSRSQFTMGFRTQGEARHFGYDQVIDHSFECHELENYRRLIGSFGVSATHLPLVPIQFHGERKRQIVLHLFPGGSCAHLKMWPASHWHALVKELLNLGYSLVLTGSMEDKARLDAFVTDKRITNGAGVSLTETAFLLKGSAAVVSVDTGIMHLAAALGVPVISLHGPTAPRRWGAIGPHVIALTPSGKHQPCIQLGFESTCKKNRCMARISVSKVVGALETVLPKTAAEATII